MNIFSKTIIAACGTALLAMSPAVASADRVFFLVGTRHIYRIGHYQYAHVDERRAIEETYADGVARDQDEYNKALDAGADPAVETPQFNQALQDLANDRDNRLGALFENADYERIRHPELQIEGDGPYQVMAINYHWRGQIEVFENFYIYAPWPGYVVVNRPYGWSYGVVYSPTVFVNLYSGWHRTYVSSGRPAFVGFVGHNGPVRISGLSRGANGQFIPRRPNTGGLSRPGTASRYGNSAVSSGTRYSGGQAGTPISRYQRTGAMTGSKYSSTATSTRSLNKPGNASATSKYSSPGGAGHTVSSAGSKYQAGRPTGSSGTGSWPNSGSRGTSASGASKSGETKSKYDRTKSGN